MASIHRELVLKHCGSMTKKVLSQQARTHNAQLDIPVSNTIVHVWYSDEMLVCRFATNCFLYYLHDSHLQRVKVFLSCKCMLANMFSQNIHLKGIF